MTTMSSQQSLPKNLEYLNSEGWALRTRKPPQRCHPEVKSYIQAVLEEEKYGHKFTPEEVVKRIKTARDSSGVKLFTPDQYLEAAQVKNQIKQFISKRNKPDDDDIASIDNRLTAAATIQKKKSTSPEKYNRY